MTAPLQPRHMLSRDAWNEAVAFATSGSRFPDSVFHGEDHWRAVATQGLRLAEICGLGTRGRVAAAIFGLFHDCRRENDDYDPEHGARGAEALRSCGVLQVLPSGLLEDLQTSMIWHDGGQTTEDPLVGLGWDADRSTLGRVGITPSFAFFSCVPADLFGDFIESGAQATSSPMSWDHIHAAAFRAL